MTTAHADLVFSALQYLCDCLAKGDVSAVTDLGLRSDQVARLAQLSLNDLRHLSGVPAHFLSISVDTESLDRVLAHMERNRSREALHDELIRHGAPYPMMFSFTGMSTRDFATRRRLLDMTGAGIGRPPVPSEEEEQRVWDAWWSKLELPLESRYLAVARETGVSLALIWPMTNEWSFSSATRAKCNDGRIVLFHRNRTAKDRTIQSDVKVEQHVRQTELS